MPLDPKDDPSGAARLQMRSRARAGERQGLDADGAAVPTSPAGALARRERLRVRKRTRTSSRGSECPGSSLGCGEHALRAATNEDEHDDGESIKYPGLAASTAQWGDAQARLKLKGAVDVAASVRPRGVRERGTARTARKKECGEKRHTSRLAQPPPSRSRNYGVPVGYVRSKDAVRKKDGVFGGVKETGGKAQEG